MDNNDPRGERVRIETIQFDTRNAKKHPQKSLDAITKSLREFGQQKPIVVDAAGVVLAGNGTLEAARAIGWESIWIVRTSLTGDAARAFAIADNRSAELGEWDFDRLREQLDDLQSAAPGLFDAAGFDSEAMVDVASHQRSTAAPEPPAEFREFDENIETDHQCPKCGYQWSGKQQ